MQVLPVAVPVLFESLVGDSAVFPDAGCAKTVSFFSTVLAKVDSSDGCVGNTRRRHQRHSHAYGLVQKQRPTVEADKVYDVECHNLTYPERLAKSHSHRFIYHAFSGYHQPEYRVGSYPYPVH